ncbi:hypothetical protein RHSIM_Rhsim04G0024400 [Rhododendron simsii]|uniref:Uncharacterized protein n=1 Tax=Rhododendron simsii TaxID=118357 RepID=A0A834H4H9_RHOSS|nr:hypothetical protein RHSIM_Rhsim04G0024400 [Rhododendron simsii]
MASLRTSLCLVLLFLLIFRSETRSPDPFSRSPNEVNPFELHRGRPEPGPVQLGRKRIKRGLIESAEEMFKSRRPEDVSEGQYGVTRLSPGGPDPKHH